MPGDVYEADAVAAPRPVRCHVCHRPCQGERHEPCAGDTERMAREHYAPWRVWVDVPRYLRTGQWKAVPL